MKNITLVTGLCFIGFASGCATSIPYSYEETCALNGLKLKGVELGEASAVAYGGNSSVFSTASGSSISCRAPENESDMQFINRTKYVAEPKVEYNDSIGTKKLLTGVGYVLYIIPGVLLKINYDRDYDKALMKSEQRLQEKAPASIQNSH